MNTEVTWEVNLESLEQTQTLAASIGQNLKGGEILELASDLGGGKTAFVRGLAQGMGSRDRVSSPSFTLSNVYESKQLALHHYDFYRLDDPGILKQELEEVLHDGRNVVAIEWAGAVESVLPSHRVAIHIRPTGEESRLLLFKYPEDMKYLFAGVEG